MTEIEEKINDYVYKELAALLFEMVPEFREEVEKSGSMEVLLDQNVYWFMYDFSLSLSEKIRKNVSSDFVSKAFMYINTVGEGHNLQLQNIVIVGILEILYTEELDRNLVCSMLSEKLQKEFNGLSRLYR